MQPYNPRKIRRLIGRFAGYGKMEAEDLGSSGGADMRQLSDELYWAGCWLHDHLTEIERIARADAARERRRSSRRCRA